MFILDSFAILCLFDKRRRRENRAIKSYLSDAEEGKITLYMSKINEGEVFYKLYKYIGAPVAIGFREDIRKGIIPLRVVAVTDRRIERASEIKARYPISYADAFCIELAQDMDMPIITGDEEFKTIENVKIVWL